MPSGYPAAAMEEAISPERAAELRKLKEQDPTQFRDALVAEADALLNTADQYEQARNDVHRILRQMDGERNVEDKASSFQGYIQKIRDAFNARG